MRRVFGSAAIWILFLPHELNKRTILIICARPPSRQKRGSGKTDHTFVEVVEFVVGATSFLRKRKGWFFGQLFFS